MNREVKLRTRDYTLTLQLGAGSSVVTDGLGGWQEVPRPDGRPITEWSGAGALKIDIPVLLNGWPSESVERDKDRLFKLGRRKDGEEEPASFKVIGPVFFSGTRMVMNGTPDFGAEQIIRNGNGKLVRLPATLHLMEYVKGDQLRISRRKKKNVFTWTTKQGDTCLSIAKDILKDPKLAKDIAKLNKIRDIRKVLKPGTVLRLSDEPLTGFNEA